MESKKLEKPCENATFQALQGVMKPDEETGGVFPSKQPYSRRYADNMSINCVLVGGCVNELPATHSNKLWSG